MGGKEPSSQVGAQRGRKTLLQRSRQMRPKKVLGEEKNRKKGTPADQVKKAVSEKLVEDGIRDMTRRPPSIIRALLPREGARTDRLRPVLRSGQGLTKIRLPEG